MDYRSGNIFNGDHLLTVRRIQCDGLEMIHDEILLHILSQEQVGAALKELPQNADRHGKAERDHGQIQRRQIDVLTGPVEQFNRRETNRGEQESVQRVQHGIPDRELRIKMAEFS